MNGSVIPPGVLTETRLVALLAHFGVHALDGDLVDAVRRQLDQVGPIAHTYRAGYVVGRHKVYGPREVRSVRQLSCTCTVRASQVCAHRAAAMVMHAWRSPTLSQLFSLQGWEIALLDLAEVPTTQDVPAAPHRGWVRYELAHPDWSPVLEVRREVVRLSKRTGKRLKPLRYPKHLRDLCARIDGVTDADRSFHELTEQISVLSDWVARGYGGSSETAADMLTGLRARWVQTLSQLDHVSFEGRPVTVAETPLLPRLEAVEVADGLALRWRPAIALLWPGPPALVMTADETVHPLAQGFSRPERLLRPLPAIPAQDVHRFVEHYVLGGRLPFTVSDVPRSAAGVVGRLILSEEADVLVVEARFAYSVQDVVVEVFPDDPAPFVRLEEAAGPSHLPTMVPRDRSGEEVLLDHLHAALLQPVPARLRGEEAWDFLGETLPQLAEHWSIFGRESLVRNRLRSPVTARVQVTGETDWFDLDVRCASGEVSVPVAEVLRSWTERKRYVALLDGTVARLPDAWLARHGSALTELEDTRSSGGYAPHAVTVAQDLLREASGNVRQWMDLVEALARFEGVASQPLPEGLTATLRPYQARGYDWLCFLADHRLGGILADDMGLGKTLQTLTMLLRSKAREGGRCLVVAPTSVVFNWKREAARFAPGLRVYVHHGSGRSETIPEVDVVVTSYALLRIDRALLEAVEWTWVVLDEAQQIKNPASKVARAAGAMNALHRLALTGTPVENNLHELYSLFQFLMPGFFGSHATFTRRYATPIHRHQDPDAFAALRRRIRPFVLRRLKSEVASELPPRTDLVLTCSFTPQQRALYDRVRDTYRRSVLDKSANKLHILEALTRLRQACCHPDLLPFPEARLVAGSPKVDLLVAHLHRAFEDGHRALVFSQWPRLLKRVAAAMELPFLYLDGQTRDRAALVDAFNAPDGPPVFLISLKAGGTGLNLVAADHVFHLDPWWNPAVEDQATDRAHRIGQDKPVFSYKIIVENTVEEKVLSLQARKRALVEATLHQEPLVVESLTRADLEAVFQ